ncbi:postacrosomal sheath WW domain-binding protein [Molossus molossus]|uniref:WBP2 N-terminal like n=1 Tax=Molossus molossus TaxID=27622 RepID=A0A7J8G3M3_MOLMO|nr:postacrosomal sheath WW domain-binding protein [Molossus molossus]KAF6454259.1 WBP2 N-terminal like [Molossus molossus]
MAMNQSHTEDRRGAIIPVGESILSQCQDVNLSFLQQPKESNFFSGTKRGTLFLTSHRVIFVTSRSVSDPMFSFMMPFDLMSNCTVEQPVFAPNYIKGNIQAAPDGGWEGEATFKLAFRHGGAIQFFYLMKKAAFAAAQGVPLQSISYWIGAPGLFVISGQGNTMCNRQMPYPVIVHGPPPVRCGAPPAGYGAPPAGYGAPPPGYGAPPPGYGAPPPGYGAPPPGYGAPPEGSEALPVEYRSPPARNEAPPLGYAVPPASNTAGSHNSVAAQPAGYEASLPSTSFSQSRSPPSMK